MKTLYLFPDGESLTLVTGLTQSRLLTILRTTSERFKYQDVRIVLLHKQA